MRRLSLFCFLKPWILIEDLELTFPIFLFSSYRPILFVPCNLFWIKWFILDAREPVMTYVIIMSCTGFWANLHSTVAWMWRNSLLEAGAICDSGGIRTHNHLVHFKWIFNHLAKLTKWLSCVVSFYLYGSLDYMLHHITYAFQSKSAPYSCLNV